MIYSMTGFAQAEVREAWGTARWELRSVNHRYLEIGLKLPEPFRELESSLRDLVKQRLQRGKIDTFLHFEPSHTTTDELKLNLPLAEKVIKVSQTLLERMPMPATLGIMDVLRWPGVIREPEFKTETLSQTITALFSQALDDLVMTRQREGNKLISFIKARAHEMQTCLQALQPLLVTTLQAQKERIIVRLQEAKAELDPSRLEQEMVYLAHRLDVTEECDRLQAHLSELERLLQQSGGIGRRLDFLLQEMNREANTLSSKANDKQVSQYAIELKVLIEQIREQVQNIE